MTVQHSIKRRFDFPMRADDLNEFASEVLANNPEAEISPIVHMGGHQLDQHPIALTLTATWES